MKERFKFLRKNLGLSQADMGKKIGISNTAISKIESGENNITDQIILSVCRAFNVREVWLRTGEGEMLLSKEPLSLEEYIRAHNFSDIEMRILKAYLEIPADLREKVLGYVNRSLTQDSEIDREVQSYREELEAEKTVEVGSPASPDTKEA